MEIMHLINVNFDIVNKTFRSITGFIRKYVNNSYCVSLYLNMNRVIKAEIDINEATKEATSLFKLVNFIRLHNAAFIITISKKWLKRARINLHYKKNKPMIFDEGTPNGAEEEEFEGGFPGGATGVGADQMTSSFNEHNDAAGHKMP